MVHFNVYKPFISQRALVARIIFVVLVIQSNISKYFKGKGEMKLLREGFDDWQSILADLWTSDEHAPKLLTDITFYCNDGTIQAHRMVLQKICPVLFLHIEATKQQSTLDVIVPDVTVEAMKGWLEVIYTGCSWNLTMDLTNAIIDVANLFGFPWDNLDTFVGSNEAHGSIETLGDLEVGGDKFNHNEIEDNVHIETSENSRQASESLPILDAIMKSPLTEEMMTQQMMKLETTRNNFR